MKSILLRLDPWEHCPDCGSLLVTVTGGMLCAYCGYERDVDDEKSGAPLTNLPGRRGEGARFHLADSGPQALDQAA